MIFLTGGTQFPFDRLVKAVDETVSNNGLDEQIYAQIGATSYRPRNFEAVKVLCSAGAAAVCTTLFRHAFPHF